jgi:diguanylate cyclase (GGDEF)-like protein
MRRDPALSAAVPGSSEILAQSSSGLGLGRWLRARRSGELLASAAPESKADALRRTPLLSCVSRRDLEHLGKMTEDIDVPSGRVLCREGQVVREFFLIIEGEVEVTKGGEVVRHLGPGDFFGETGLIERTLSATTVTATTRLRFFVMSSQGFWSLLHNNTEAERRVLRRLVVENVLEREIAEDALRREAARNEHQALHDPLTGLPNRTLFHDRIEQAILSAARAGTDVTVLMMDLDRFKEVNDTLGHAAGDSLLIQIATRLRGAIRASDTVARLGGDEFGVLLLGAGPSTALPAIEKIRAALEEPVLVDELPIGVEASIGAAFFPDHGANVDTLLQHADVAMYVAKEENLGYSFYDTVSHGRDPVRLTLVGELRRAIDERELVLHYQPKAFLSDGEVQSVEALVRWNHPTRGLVPPDEFIPLAQQTGLMKPLTFYVLDAAMRQCVAWQKEGLVLSIAVNLSMRNLLDVDFPDEVQSLIDTWGIEPSRLELEITESTMLTNPTRTKTVLSRLDEMGIRLSIDDFGVGYTSLAYLKSLPVSEIKIDRSFVMAMLEDEDDAVIVRSTIELARNLGLEVVAEGVETEAAWNHLSGLGCDIAQGYYLSRPVAADELGAWLRSRPSSSDDTHAERPAA